MPVSEGHERAPSSLFDRLADCLARDEPLVRRLFDQEDWRKAGALSQSGLARLTELLLGERPSDAELSLFWEVADADSGGRITYPEFTAVVADCQRCGRGDEEDLRFKDQVKRVVRRLAVSLLEGSGASLWEAFQLHDSGRRGSLQHREVLRMVNALVPGMAKKEQRMLLAKMGDLDADGDGAISFKELQSALMVALESAIGIGKAAGSGVGAASGAVDPADRTGVGSRRGSSTKPMLDIPEDEPADTELRRHSFRTPSEKVPLDFASRLTPTRTPASGNGFRRPSFTGSSLSRPNQVRRSGRAGKGPRRLDGGLGGSSARPRFDPRYAAASGHRRRS